MITLGGARKDGALLDFLDGLHLSNAPGQELAADVGPKLLEQVGFGGAYQAISGSHKGTGHATLFARVIGVRKRCRSQGAGDIGKVRGVFTIIIPGDRDSACSIKNSTNHAAFVHAEIARILLVEDRKEEASKENARLAICKRRAVAFAIALGSAAIATAIARGFGQTGTKGGVEKGIR